jgi:hypothetical protein
MTNETPSDTAHPEGEREKAIERVKALRSWLAEKHAFAGRGELPDDVRALDILLSESRPQGEEGLWRPISEAPRGCR